MSDQNKRLAWEALYHAALLETDRRQLSARIEAAQSAIQQRVQELLLAPAPPPDERQAIEDALNNLRVLRRE